MVQENTSKTDAEIEMKEYPAPPLLNRVGIKVGLGMGLLLSLFAFAGLVSLFQARVVEEKVREITEVAEPASAAAYEMEINVIGTGSGVLKYLQTGDDIHRQRVAKDEADFERFKAQYDRLVKTPKGRQLGDRVSLLYQEYKALGDTLMDQADRREVLFATIGENFQELDGILDNKIQVNITSHGPDGPEKLRASMSMEANIAEVGNWLGSYLRDPKEEYKLHIFDDTADFWQAFNQFKNYRLTQEEEGWAAELGDLFSQTQALSIEIIELEDDLNANLAELVDLQTRLDAVLDDEIQVLTNQDLAEATQIAVDMEARTNTMVLLLLLGGLACGALIAVAITRGITDPVSKLVAASRAIARGDLSLRANIQSKDEFGILGDAFNEMTVQQQRAHDELEVRVQERTEELSQLNEVMDLADEVARIVTSTLNIDEVYQKFALEVKKMVDFDRMNINIIDYERGVYEIKYHFGEEAPQRPISFTGPLEGTTTGQVANTGRTLVQHDIARVPRSPVGEKYLKMRLRSNVKVPLIIKGRVIGTLGLRSRQVGAYGPQEQAILERLASQIAPALETSQLYLRLQANMEEMDLADEVARIVTSTLNIDEVYEKFTLEVKKLVDFDRMNINLIDHEARVFTVKYLAGEDMPGREVGRARPLANTRTQHIIETGRTLVQADITKDSQFPESLADAKAGLLSSIMVPLVTKGQVIGVMRMRSRRVGFYGPREQAILERLASHIAPALETSQLYLRLQANMEEMDLADEVARIVTSTLNIDQVYEKFAQELKKLVDFDRMNINIIDSTTQTFLIKYLSGPSLPGRGKGDVVPMEGTKTQWVFTNGQALTPADSSKEQNNGSILAATEKRYQNLGLRSCIAVPLISNGSVIGSMILRSCKMGCYGSKEQAILERLASQIAPAMENARLHEERVRAEEQLSHAQRMESVGRLAGGVAHDFNNLLTAIMGYTQLSLGETSDESNVSSHLREIQKATQRATNLTSQLLTFSRHQVIEPKVIDLNDLIIDLDKMLRRLIGENIELVTLPAPDLDPVKVDRGQMEQVLMNLAVNARDAMPTGGKITVETANVIQNADYALRHPGASPGRLVMLSVSDTGTGIPEEVRDHIFEPFFTTKDVGKGTGLGLSTCYGIIQQGGGHIEVDSEPGQGTSFKVYLPVTDESYEAQLPQADTCILPQGQETVLLAEDEPLVRSMVATVLRDRGYSVLETANGAEALGMVQKHEGEDIQLLLTDVVMPQMSGPELAEQVWATHPDIKVLFTSGYTGDSISIVNNYPKSANFLPKPYLPEALVVKVREVLDQRAA